METHLKPADLASYLEAPSIPEQALMSLFDPDTALTIFDIGACEGEDSIRYCRRFPSARLFTFEALPANQGLIRENFVRYAITRAELVPLALSDRFGTAAFHVSSGRPKEEFAGKDWNYGNKSSSLLAPASSAPMHDWIEFRDSITVPTETLARFCSARGIRSIDFVHLDVQGAEGLVLAGAGPMLRQVGSLWLEVSEAEVYSGQPRRPGHSPVDSFGLHREHSRGRNCIGRWLGRPCRLGGAVYYPVDGDQRCGHADEFGRQRQCGRRSDHERFRDLDPHP
jgi:FkbM family methyltransferase